MEQGRRENLRLSSTNHHREALVAPRPRGPAPRAGNHDHQHRARRHDRALRNHPAEERWRSDRCFPVHRPDAGREGPGDQRPGGCPRHHRDQAGAPAGRGEQRQAQRAGGHAAAGPSGAPEIPRGNEIHAAPPRAGRETRVDRPTRGWSRTRGQEPARGDPVRDRLPRGNSPEAGREYGRCPERRAPTP